MEMYARRKGWDLEGLGVECDYTPAQRGCPTHFELILRLRGNYLWPAMWGKSLTEDDPESARLAFDESLRAARLEGQNVAMRNRAMRTSQEAARPACLFSRPSLGPGVCAPIRVRAAEVNHRAVEQTKPAGLDSRR